MNLNESIIIVVQLNFLVSLKNKWLNLLILLKASNLKSVNLKQIS